MLNREAILAADDLRREEVDVPEWGGAVCVRLMTATEKVAFADRMEKAGDDTSGFLVDLAALTLCDDSGVRLFDSNGDLEALGGKASAVLERICKAAQNLNGLTGEAVDAAAKNSDESQ